MPRILIVEDDELISAFVEKGLRASGYSTFVVDDGQQGVYMALNEEFDLVILDVALPELDGFQVLQEIRGHGSDVPVIVLTGRPELRDAVACLDVGADDYITKPFRFEELQARVRARLRVRGGTDDPVMNAGAVRLDLRSRRATVGEHEVDLSEREFALLMMFMAHPDHVLTREQILSHVWGYFFDPGTNVVNVYVAALRKKIGDDAIQTVRGVGYRFSAANQ